MAEEQVSSGTKYPDFSKRADDFEALLKRMDASTAAAKAAEEKVPTFEFARNAYYELCKHMSMGDNFQHVFVATETPDLIREIVDYACNPFSSLAEGEETINKWKDALIAMAAKEMLDPHQLPLLSAVWIWENARVPMCVAIDFAKGARMYAMQMQLWGTDRAGLIAITKSLNHASGSLFIVEMQKRYALTSI